MKENRGNRRTFFNKAGTLGCAVIALVLLLGGISWGQQEQKPAGEAQQHQEKQAAEPKIAIDVKTVNVPVTVRDKHGKIISTLAKDDFQIDEDGKPQTVNYFAREKDLPLRLGLLVDTSLSQRRVLEQERTASYSFLDHMLREKDLAFVIHFDHEVELLEDFTGARPKLQAALQSLETPQYQQVSNNGGQGGGQSGGQGGPGGGMGGGRRGGGGGRRFSGGTLLYDAVYLAGDELMNKQRGRKAVIILSDGVHQGSHEGITSAIETSQRADTVVYSILFKDDEAYRGRGASVSMGPYGIGRRGGRYPQERRPDGKKVLEQMSRDTGGRMFEVSKKEPVDKIYAQIEEELRNQYTLGYTLAKDTGSGYHKIHVTTKQKDLVVQARDGYYSGQ